MAPKTALVVDADKEIRAMLSRVLPAPDWDIREVPDNAAVLELAGSLKFELVLTSEKTSGFEDLKLLRKIRQAHPHTRVILLADESTPADVLEAMRESAFSYFTKPFSLTALEEMVRRAVEEPCWDDGIELLIGSPNWIRVAARCDMNTADRLLQFVHEMIDLPEQEKNEVAMALRELLLNAIEHGGKFDPQKYVELSYIRSKRAVSCRVKDPGEGFSLAEIPHAAVMNPPDDPLRHLGYRESENLRPGGFGVLLSRNSVDELIYNDKGNEVLLIKYMDHKC